MLFKQGLFPQPNNVDGVIHHCWADFDGLVHDLGCVVLMSSTKFLGSSCCFVVLVCNLRFLYTTSKELKQMQYFPMMSTATWGGCGDMLIGPVISLSCQKSSGLVLCALVKGGF